MNNNKKKIYIEACYFNRMHRMEKITRDTSTKKRISFID